MDPLSSTPTFPGTSYGIGERIGLIWEQTREPVMVPLLRVMVALCLTMSLMLFVERVYMGIVITVVKLFGRKLERRYKWEPMKDDVELGNSAYPMVLVQIPMYNEKEVYTLHIYHHDTPPGREIYIVVSCSLTTSAFRIWFSRSISSPLALHVAFHGLLTES